MRSSVSVGLVAVVVVMCAGCSSDTPDPSKGAAVPTSRPASSSKSGSPTTLGAHGLPKFLELPQDAAGVKVSSTLTKKTKLRFVSATSMRTTDEVMQHFTARLADWTAQPLVRAGTGANMTIGRTWERAGEIVSLNVGGEDDESQFTLSYSSPR